MKHLSAVICFLLHAVFLLGQDSYHKELEAFLSDSLLLTNISPVVLQNEQANLDRRYIYGDVVRTISNVNDLPFSIQEDISVKSAGDNRWDSGTGYSNLASIAKDDVILITFWARKLSATSELTVLAEDATSFAKELYQSYDISSDWTRYFFPFKSTKSFAREALTLGFHLASQVQHFQLGGFTAYNLGNIELEQAPRTFAEGSYGGSEADAGWRAPAQRRIDSLRRKNLTIRVVNKDGLPMPDLRVSIDMQKHEFGFGSAVVACRMPGNNCFNQTYLDKLLNLDGAGHGFNVAVTENALKWDAWEEQWIGSPDQTRNAITWLNDYHIETRGHTLIWPGWDHMPDDMQQNSTNLTYLIDRINNRIETMLTDPTLGELITEWDVLNEITLVRDLEMAFSTSSEYQTGRELYGDILQRVTELKPNHLNYINDFVVFSGAGGLSATVERYHSYIQEIIATDGAKLDGIGFQSHIGMSPISIYKVEETLNDFYNRYGLRMKVTEYDINKQVAPETQAAYLADFLTLIFSHPGMDAFLMWGFWDGNHWLNNAPIFNQDWSMKPSGQVFIDKVFKEWWTNDAANTSSMGTVTFRPFKGQHKISIEYDGNLEEHTIHTGESDTIVIQLGTTSTDLAAEAERFVIAPNPSPDGHLRILTAATTMLNLDIYSIDGKLVRTYHKLPSEEPIFTNLEPGIYFANISNQSKTTFTRFIIQ